MSTVINFPKLETAPAEKKKGPGSKTSGARKPRASTSDKFSPGQSTWGTAPIDWCIQAFETLNPIQLNKSKTTGLDRNTANAVWYKALGVLPDQRVYDVNSKAATLATAIHEHAAQSYPLQGKTIGDISSEMEAKFGVQQVAVAEDEPVYSLHPGDGGRWYVSNDESSEWVNDGNPVPADDKFEIYQCDASKRWYIANSAPGSAKWLDEAPFFPRAAAAAIAPPAPPPVEAKRIPHGSVY